MSLFTFLVTQHFKTFKDIRLPWSNLQQPLLRTNIRLTPRFQRSGFARVSKYTALPHWPGPERVYVSGGTRITAHKDAKVDKAVSLHSFREAVDAQARPKPFHLVQLLGHLDTPLKVPQHLRFKLVQWSLEKYQRKSPSAGSNLRLEFEDWKRLRDNMVRDGYRRQWTTAMFRGEERRVYLYREKDHAIVSWQACLQHVIASTNSFLRNNTSCGLLIEHSLDFSEISILDLRVINGSVDIIHQKS